MWTRLMDMHSGGSQKLDYCLYYIEADDVEDAVRRFQARYGRDPDNVTCECCGADYSVTGYETLSEATVFDRGRYNNYNFEAPTPLAKYLVLSPEILVLSLRGEILSAQSREPSPDPDPEHPNKVLWVEKRSN